jgi:hypothetical protein
MTQASHAEILNRDCYCIGLDMQRLAEAVRAGLNEHGLQTGLIEQRPHLFAQVPVFVARTQVEQMAALVAAVEQVVALPSYQERVLSGAPEIARHPQAPLGVFMGFDFHLGAAGPQLIEINTNAGGALLSLLVGRAQRVCCPPVSRFVRSPSDLPSLDEAFVAMFRREWALARGNASLERIAIVDEAPAEQFLYPEFLLFQQLFRAQGIEAIVADPCEFSYREGALWHPQGRIDLVYNRLTDFYLQAPALAALRAAYLDDAAVFTPHPRAHALYADKRNLALLSDEHALEELGVPAPVREVLCAGIPRTELVQVQSAERLWAARKQLFFKPAAGYGSKAAYRGDKLTRRVWGEILAGDYVAQRLVVPSERHIRRDDGPVPLKLDVRNYAYAGSVQLMSARLYQGQTTNFRTQGGGFAPVFTAPTITCC